uniref:F-box domain-containing protein n=1 Tax=Quercus lobata TaxID=97700 RepID=A0A7N2N0P3_QUELO
MAEWSKLPNDILLLIAKRLETHMDLLRFRSVCTSWQSSVSPRKPHWLKIPTYDTQVADHFYLLERTIYLIESRENPDQTTPPECWYSYCYDVARFSERLFAVDECRKTIAIHPTSGASIDTFCGESFFKDCLHEVFLIELNDNELMFIHKHMQIYDNVPEDPTSPENYLYCIMPNGKRLRFPIFTWENGWEQNHRKAASPILELQKGSYVLTKFDILLGLIIYGGRILAAVSNSVGCLVTSAKFDVIYG